MSRAPHAVTDPGAGTGPGTGHPQYLPQSAPTQAPPGVSNFVDGSGPIFSMYVEMASEEDTKMVEGWKADADGILIFTGLFSASVASLISVSIQDIRPNPQDTSNFYLANIYQTISDPNQSNISLPSSLPPFSPPTYAVWVNSLWFLSLVISLTCALLATLLQQWARKYLKVTQPRYSPHKRARIRAFFFEGVDKFLLPWAVEALPTLLHLSLFLFLTGVAVFLCNVNFTTFKIVLSWVSICTALYGSITFMPIFRHDSPYHTPLSLPAWHIVTGIPYVIHRVLRWFTLLVYSQYGAVGGAFDRAEEQFRDAEQSYRKLLMQGMQKTAEETALKSPSEIDTRAFLWTFDSLDEDHELERFFSGLPGFRSSTVVNDPLPSLTEEEKWKLLNGLIGLSDRTFSSDLLPDPVKTRRAVICARAIDPGDISQKFQLVLNRIVFRGQYGPVQSVGIAHLVRGWDTSKDVQMTSAVSAIVSSVIARAQRRDGHWFAIASDELGIPEAVLRDYAANGNSLSLAILIYVTRQQFSHYREWYWPGDRFSEVLKAASKFDVRNTSPDLQHEFCALWNQIVQEAQNDNDRWTAFETLRPIRNIYIALHRDTDSSPTQFSAFTTDQDDILWNPSSYPLCNVASHIHEDSALTTFDNTVLPPASLTSPDAPSSSIPAPLHVVESPTDVPLLDNLHPAHQATIPVTSPGLATTGAMPDIVTSGITTPTSKPPLSSTFPPTAVDLQHNAHLPTPSDTPNLPSSASSDLVLDNILPIGPPLSSHLPITRPDLTSSCPESYRSIIVTTTPSASPGPTSAPDLGAAAEDNGSLEPGLCKEEDTLDLPLVNHEIHASTLELPLQSPSLPLVADSDIAVVGRSLSEPNAELSGDDPPHASHRRYDIV